MMPVPWDQDRIAAQLAGEEKCRAWEISHGNDYRQMSLFDDFHVTASPTKEDGAQAVFGVI